jgi:mRNA-degrading endonuclease RelE of RelBE toxin-antitoxin system
VGQAGPLPAWVEQIEAFARGQDPPAALPWVRYLDPNNVQRLREELVLLFQEPVLTCEPLDWPEVMDVLEDYAELAGWDGPLHFCDGPATSPARYRVDIRSRDQRALMRASAAVREAATELLEDYLTTTPTAADRLRRGSLKKLENRDVWQIALPDGYRLRYLIDESTSTVFVVYLGPHSDGEVSGREPAIRAEVQRRLKRQA